MSDRYFVESPLTADRAVLAGPEAHHLIHVMRAKPGGHVTLFDGSGWQFDAVIQRVGRSEVELTVLARAEIDRELAVELSLAVALPKGDRQKWLVEKAVELGVTRLVPLETARGVAQPEEKALHRLRRGVIEASKQCGRNRLMAIAEPERWADFVARTADVPCRLLAHPGREATARQGLFPPIGDRVAMAIGPEGGFSEDEVALAVHAGWQRIELGPRILRVETAAVLLAAMVGVCS